MRVALCISAQPDSSHALLGGGGGWASRSDTLSTALCIVHRFTAASITASGAAALKGRDAGVVEAVTVAAAELPVRFEVYLARFAKQARKQKGQALQ